MHQLTVDTSDLLKWGRYLEEIPQRTPQAAARALNAYGEEIVRGTAQELADKTGLDVNAVGSLIIVREATPDDLVWEMDARAVAPGDDMQGRDWNSRDINEFQKDTLMKIVPFDTDVCDVCKQAIEENPYTFEDIQKMQEKWANYQPPYQLRGPVPRTNLVHPNCRCHPEPWQSMRRVPISAGDMAEGPPQLFNGRQLGRKVADELLVQLRAIPR